ncbi:hypothetical protein SPSYN_01899 [Sporotomaculum syntrophicum]|uniref:Uncharacterized protein n=1 Tax=Sporotomaculum syntrophicum TaxID=182264 RepID=A0A9D3AYS0_9FIRM|nr:hypothetical protein SPSYN_01899 [Sporotomaculum syntrophicum]
MWEYSVNLKAKDKGYHFTKSLALIKPLFKTHYLHDNGILVSKLAKHFDVIFTYIFSNAHH